MKRLYLNLKIAWRALLNFKFRTTLAVLGVFFGTFSLIVVSNLSKSLSLKAVAEVDKFGKNLLIVQSGIVRKVGTTTRLLSESKTLTVNDAQAIADSLENVKDISSSDSKPFPVRYGDIVLKGIPIIGVMPNYQEIRNFYVKEGRFISENDNDNLNKVAVLGGRVAEKLFGDQNPIDKYVLVFRVPLRVIGVMEEKVLDISGADQDNQVFIPLNTFLRRFVNKDYINTIFVQAVDESSISNAKTRIEELLRKRHKIGEGQKDDFTVIDLKDVMALKTQTMSMITFLGRTSAAIAFLIGGIGILSIMILIVNERRLEIGIRRAVGATKRDIILQFLTEASFISIGGGTVGVILSFVATLIIYTISKLPFVFSPVGYIIAFIASASTGILAGIYPSKKAITIQPVDVIRS